MYRGYVKKKKTMKKKIQSVCVCLYQMRCLRFCSPLSVAARTEWASASVMGHPKTSSHNISNTPPPPPSLFFHSFPFCLANFSHQCSHPVWFVDEPASHFTVRERVRLWSAATDSPSFIPLDYSNTVFFFYWKHPGCVEYNSASPVIRAWSCALNHQWRCRNLVWIDFHKPRIKGSSYPGVRHLLKIPITASN